MAQAVAPAPLEFFLSLAASFFDLFFQNIKLDGSQLVILGNYFSPMDCVGCGEFVKFKILASFDWMARVAKRLEGRRT